MKIQATSGNLQDRMYNIQNTSQTECFYLQSSPRVCAFAILQPRVTRTTDGIIASRILSRITYRVELPAAECRGRLYPAIDFPHCTRRGYLRCVFIRRLRYAQRAADNDCVMRLRESGCHIIEPAGVISRLLRQARTRSVCAHLSDDRPAKAPRLTLPADQTHPFDAFSSFFHLLSRPTERSHFWNNGRTEIFRFSTERKRCASEAHFRPSKIRGSNSRKSRPRRYERTREESAGRLWQEKRRNYL